MISQVALPTGFLLFLAIAAVVSVAVLATIGFAIWKVSKRMGLANSTSGCLVIAAPILVIFLIWGMVTFGQHQHQPAGLYPPDDLPQYEQEMQQTGETYLETSRN